jgi:hypothetical protein
VVHALFARGREWPRAACRLLQPNAIREHDHGRPNSAAPHPRSPAGAAFLPTRERGACAPNPVSSGLAPRTHVHLSVKSGLRMAAPLAWSASRGLEGQGPFGDCSGLSDSSFHRDRSRWKLHPNPVGSDTSCRRLVMIRRPERPASSGVDLPPSTNPPRSPTLARRRVPEPAAADPRRIGPPLTLSREGGRDPPHPRCLPSPDRPF